MKTKTKTKTTDQQLALHDLQELRERLTGALATNNQQAVSDAESPDSANGLMSASGFLGA